VAITEKISSAVICTMLIMLTLRPSRPERCVRHARGEEDAEAEHEQRGLLWCAAEGVRRTG
jgi:hypothetical protein